MVPLAAALTKPMPRLYAPPSPSTYHPLERWWGLWEWPWHGAKLSDAEMLLGWAKQMPGQGMPPVVALSRPGDAQGIARGKAAMPAVAARLKRDPTLPQYDLVINPAPAT